MVSNAMRLFLLPAAAVLTSTLSVIAQGPLTPPGGPAPTMRTLDQVEARIPISAAHTPGDATATFRITAPGSYYLTGNITGESGKAGIFVDASHVMIDLNGFTMTGPGAGSAIDTTFPPMARENITVLNGTVTNWGFAISLRQKTRLERITATGNAFDGISAGNGSMVIDCIASNNGQEGVGVGSSSVVRSTVARENGTGGIGAGSGSVVANCTAGSNGFFGILAGANSTVESCTADSNGSTGIVGSDRVTIVDCSANGNASGGIAAFDSVTVQRCTASSNAGVAGISVDDRSQVLDCVADFNGTVGTVGSGIRTATRGFIKNCSATANLYHGISVAGESVVAENRASDNGRAAQAAGIRITGSGSRIEGNQVRDNNGFGIQADSPAGDVIIRNTAGANAPGGNYFPASGANVGPVSNVTGATHPLANIQF